ncbi:hypothetical protein PLEOSDRAFT_1102313 [Pleurotus ostreatus PC15]|uniref:Uncharacterized protein n=1 Tax=Pleurotus ostreatus (strain PC15) TaxID=1137138 RepID=A0A067NTF4_PLEO1|nr:hypothetical protein PLEOSDRAFT_1102313 [Pleurotus ostreatus PC15]
MGTAFAALEHSNQHDYARICKSRRLKPLRDPFWEDLPFVNIFAAITPDILHQLHQGVMKHLISWITSICHPEEIDECVKRLPPNHSIRIFHKGITSLSRYATARSRLISATRALLDFLYLAQYPTKDIFKVLGAREDFNILKLHSLVHYARAIKLYGTTDNYSTESTERLHIDFAKDAYAATNHKDEFPQMTAWLERREKVLFHEKFIEWRLTAAATAHPSPGYWEPPDRSLALSHHLTKHPTRKAVPIELISSPSGYGATFFRSALARYLIHEKHPLLSQREVTEQASDHTIPFDSLPVFHKLKFKLSDNEDTYNAIHAYPGRQLPKKGDVAIPQRFDTALVRVADKTVGSSSITGLRVGRVRLIFATPKIYSAQRASRTAEEVNHLAYIKWYSPLTRLPDANYRMYTISRIANEASVVPVSAIKRSIHLYPKWGGPVCREWTSSNVLDQCSTFFVNPFKDHHTYFNLEPYAGYSRTSMIKDEDDDSNHVPGQRQIESDTTSPRYYLGLEWPKHFPPPPSFKRDPTWPVTQTLTAQRNEIELFCGDDLHFDLYQLLHPVPHSSTQHNHTTRISGERVNSDSLGCAQINCNQDSKSDSGEDILEVKRDEVVPSSVDGEEDAVSVCLLGSDDEQLARNYPSAHQAYPQLLRPHKLTFRMLIVTLRLSTLN